MRRYLLPCLHGSPNILYFACDSCICRAFRQQAQPNKKCHAKYEIQNRPKDLAVLSTESEIAKTMDLGGVIIHDFANIKGRQAWSSEALFCKFETVVLTLQFHPYLLARNDVLYLSIPCFQQPCRGIVELFFAINALRKGASLVIQECKGRGNRQIFLGLCPKPTLRPVPVIHSRARAGSRRPCMVVNASQEALHRVWLGVTKME